MTRHESRLYFAIQIAYKFNAARKLDKKKGRMGRPRERKVRRSERDGGQKLEFVPSSTRVSTSVCESLVTRKYIKDRLILREALGDLPRRRQRLPSIFHPPVCCGPARALRKV